MLQYIYNWLHKLVVEAAVTNEVCYVVEIAVTSEVCCVVAVHLQLAA